MSPPPPQRQTVGVTRMSPLLVCGAILALAGCGTSSSPQRPAPPTPGPHPSRPGLEGRVLVVLERQDLQFGRHDTLTVGRDGRANLVLAHGRATTA
jgi:hypothetical protein